MSSPISHDALIRAAESAGETDAILDAYMAAWADDVSANMTGETFASLFQDSSCAKRAIVLATKSAKARRALRRASLGAMAELGDPDLVSVVAALWRPDDFIKSWTTSRAAMLAAERERTAAAVVKGMVHWMGREWTRQRVLSWWAATDLLEEDRRGIVDALESTDILTSSLSIQLGPLARRRRGRARQWADDHVRVEASSDDLRRGIESLLTMVRVPADFRDAALSSDELERCTGEHRSLGDLFGRSLQRLRGRSRFWHEMYREFTDAGGMPQPGSSSNGAQTFAVALIRWLHMRLILGAPALGGALHDPRQHLIPDVLLHVLGQDAVTYSPEVRLHQAVDRRWRAHWAELSGEALSTLVLEDLIELDLTLLRRVPERTDSETPDFMASTRQGEPIVFEAKGATDFATHRRQRRKALAQLGKASGPSDSAEGTAQGAIAWKSTGRAFASCFYAAPQNSSKSSCLHLADPPFPFHELFVDGWQEQARRMHYAGLAEAAGLYALADQLREPDSRGDRPLEDRSELFSVTAERNDGRFRGTFTMLAEAAQRLRHPRPAAFVGGRMFVGIAEERFFQLSMGRLPGPLDETEGVVLPAVGVLPSRRTPGAARGVYSLLSDGSLLAFESE